jgi:hypothetical protein
VNLSVRLRGSLRVNTSHKDQGTIDGGVSLTRADLERAGQITRISAGPQASR